MKLFVDGTKNELFEIFVIEIVIKERPGLALVETLSMVSTGYPFSVRNHQKLLVLGFHQVV
jgi:hypothetical protein